MSTRAISCLARKKIAHQLVAYAHEEKGARFAARAVGFPLAQTIKTLVADLGNHQYRLVLMPGDREVSMKKLARACGVKRAAMADAATAQRVTGYLVGGISPFGTRQAMKVLMEPCLLGFAEVLINAGRRGLLLKMAPKDIARVLGAEVISVAEGP
ncbi:MAG TPA: Cys-tRNA(Pro) deacylase [Desulfobacteraceae bacterium]|mgnify:CR=1 FL=1|nr:Cys-tRNA(Pro) deacylase [Deltaproteobacteria bacterium]RLB96929.1 MAG: Cys-tRNA(Pro) deacylase [Deltaproteobacteria bacterium]HDI60057.1 Cys-tRNA(Pro) deacylase [Desulfobacteraceae bacterium]